MTCEAMLLQPKHILHACARASQREVSASSHCHKLFAVLPGSVMLVHVHVSAPMLWDRTNVVDQSATVVVLAKTDRHMQMRGMMRGMLRCQRSFSSKPWRYVR